MKIDPVGHGVATDHKDHEFEVTTYAVYLDPRLHYVPIASDLLYNHIEANPEKIVLFGLVPSKFGQVTREEDFIEFYRIDLNYCPFIDNLTS